MRQHFIVVNVVPQRTRPEDSHKKLDEAFELISTYTDGCGEVTHIVQQRMHPDQTTYIGKGKVQELFEYIKSHQVKTIILNDIVSANQVYDLKMALWEANPDIQVWDRVDLILKIFQKHANTAEAKLQIELASMQHMGPRIYGMGMIMSRQGGGVGNRGIGETNTERMKRHWRAEMRKTEEKLEKFQTDHKDRLSKRKEQGVKSVAIVGYTNAGKTTIFNVLTGKAKLEKNVLFATLDSATGYLKLGTQNQALSTLPILITDTIGFIRNLPAKLIKAFHSTLLETIHADLLIHVVDAVDAEIEDKILAVQTTLKQLGAEQKPVIMVLNKIDLPPQSSLERIQAIIDKYHPICTTAKDPSSFTILTQKIIEEVG